MQNRLQRSFRLLSDLPYTPIDARARPCHETRNVTAQMDPSAATPFVAGLDVERHDVRGGAVDRTFAARHLPVGLLLAEPRLNRSNSAITFCVAALMASLVRSPSSSRWRDTSSWMRTPASSLDKSCSSRFASRTAARRSLVAAYASLIISRHS
jgi:hypothetical protein